ncbi:MAG TPA: carboxypeptidase regulatory-like domain-containing protein [Vicinamibacterales bacterium]|nr:carboxypeptidase regulatory-like domain-containing protein [Vicinamibacterales bacterium]
MGSRAFACALFALLIAAPVAAQTVGRLTGTVRDEAGEPIKGATITAENPEMAPRQFTTATDHRGRFSILGLRRATWKLTIQAPGYDPVTYTMPVQILRPNPPLEVTLVRSLAPALPLALGDVDARRLQEELDEAAALARADRIAEAIAAYQRVLRKVPALTSIYLQLGQLHERAQNRAAAIEAYRALLAADPQNARARDALARLGAQP